MNGKSISFHLGRWGWKFVSPFGVETFLKCPIHGNKRLAWWVPFLAFPAKLSSFSLSLLVVKVQDFVKELKLLLFLFINYFFFLCVYKID